MDYKYNPKTIVDLMKHLRENRGIEISDTQTRQMMNYGYYHAYKGYRFFKKSGNLIPYTTFEQLIAVIDYDNGLKAAFYPELMFLETAFKNIVVAHIVEDVEDAGFAEIRAKKMNDFSDDEVLRKQRKHLADKITSTVAQRNTQNNQIVAHFCERGDVVPIWAIFEVISLGDFAMFTYCLNKYVRVSLLRQFKFNIDQDIDNQLLAHILYTLKDLRNALAHNNVIFDTRFKEREISDIVAIWLNKEMRLDSVDFTSIVDYYLLLTVLLKKIEYENSKLNAFVSEVENVINALYKGTPANIYTKLTTTKLVTKLTALAEYLKR